MIKKVWLTTITEISLALIIIFSGSMSFAENITEAAVVFEEQVSMEDPEKAIASAGPAYDAAENAAVKDVKDRIAALPDPENAALIYRVHIDKAKEALNMLTAEEQASIPETAKKKLAALDEAVKKLELAEDEKKAADVAEMMNTAKGTRAGKGKDAAEAARIAYNGLTEAQRALIPNDALLALIDAEDAYEAGRIFKSGDAWYKILPSGDVTYKEPANMLCKSASVPNQVRNDGYYYLVVKISIGAFKNCRNLEELVINRNIRSIGEYAFKNTPKLTKILIRTKMLKAGKIYKAFANGGKFKGAGLTISVPQGYVYQYNNIFKGSGRLNINAKVQVQVLP